LSQVECVGPTNLAQTHSDFKGEEAKVELMATAPATESNYLKDGAYYCYRAYVLRISRYSDFLSPMLTNTGIFLRGLKLSGESRSL